MSSWLSAAEEFVRRDVLPFLWRTVVVEPLRGLAQVARGIRRAGPPLVQGVAAALWRAATRPLPPAARAAVPAASGWAGCSGITTARPAEPLPKLFLSLCNPVA
jgi:hypothetical protein